MRPLCVAGPVGSATIERLSAQDAETFQFFSEYVGKFTKTREDLKTWSDVLDLDDYVSFGGKA